MSIEIKAFSGIPEINLVNIQLFCLYKMWPLNLAWSSKEGRALISQTMDWIEKDPSLESQDFSVVYFLELEGSCLSESSLSLGNYKWEDRHFFSLVSGALACSGETW